MSVLKNNGVNIGSGDPSSIANGDLKRVGDTLYIRDAGAWTQVGGGGGLKVAVGTTSSTGGTITITPGFTNGGAIMVWSTYSPAGYIGGQTRSANGSAVTFNGSIGGNNDAAANGWWIGIGNI